MKLVTVNTNLLFLHHCDRDFDQPTVNDGVVGTTFPPSAATTNRPPRASPTPSDYNRSGCSRDGAVGITTIIIKAT